MSMVDDFKRMCEDISFSFDARMGGLNALKKETNDFLFSFRKEHTEEAKAFRDFLKDETEKRRNTVGEMLSGFKAQLRTMADDWRKTNHVMAEKRMRARG